MQIPPLRVRSTRSVPPRCHFTRAVLVALLPVLAAGSAWANGHESWPPEPVYKLHQKDIPIEDSDKAEHYEEHVEYSLTFEGHDDPVFIARAYDGGKDGYTRLGFSEDSFKLAWLDYKVLLHASWSTAVQGSGRHVMKTEVLFLNSDGAWREIFRDSHFVYDRNGWQGSTTNTFSFQFDSRSRTLIVRCTFATTESWEGQWYPLAKQSGIGIEEHNKDVPVYGKSYQFIREWPCKVTDGEIRWGNGTLNLMLYHAFATAEVVQFLLDTVGHHGVHTSSEADLDERLQTLNPRFGGAGACWGDVLLDQNLPPYEPDSGHYYWRNPA